MKHKYERLCVFPLPIWADNKYFTKASYLECVELECHPSDTIGRFGLYIDKRNKRCWIECQFGCHEYPNGYDTELYIHQLDLHKPLCERSVIALKSLAKDRLLNKQMLNMLNMDIAWKMNHARRIDGLKSRKRLIEFKRTRGL